MKGRLLVIKAFIFAFLLIGCGEKDQSEDVIAWQIGPFEKIDSLNPVLKPEQNSSFYCPVRKDSVLWEIKDVFNPASIVKDGKVYLLYRAEDTVGIHAGTSRLGLAISEDGFHFKKMPEPVLYPDRDFMKKYEWEGGVEDPRIVMNPEGNYIMTYTAYDGDKARLCIAISTDLIHWEKKGLAFGDNYDSLWSKSGSIISKIKDNKLTASKINDLYWMYWGDTDIFAATSSNLIDWEPVMSETGDLLKVFGPRDGYFDSDLVEPGPPAILTEYGILLIYNSRNHKNRGIDELSDWTYSAGQILLSRSDPLKVLARSEKYFISPEKSYEIKGQVGNVVFVEGLIKFKNKWFLYYGTADSKIALAVADK